jgi:hypothetical protein
MNIDNIKSQPFGFCVDCNIYLTKENKSEWEVFIDDTNKTYPICKNCNQKRENITDNR